MTSISPEDQVWFRQINALVRREITIESILGVTVFNKCDCGADISRGVKNCSKCALENLKKYSAEAADRMKYVPLVKCPKCQYTRYTKLCLNGICWDCNHTIEMKQEEERYAKAQAKPKSLKDKVNNFVDYSQPKEKDDYVPF